MKISIAVNVALSALQLWLWTTPYSHDTHLFGAGINCGMAITAVLVHVMLVIGRR